MLYLFNSIEFHLERRTSTHNYMQEYVDAAMSSATVKYERPPGRDGNTAITNVAGNLVYYKGSSDDDDGWCKVASDVAPDVLFTVRFLIHQATIVAIAVTVGIVLIELGPPLLVLVSRVVVDLPLAILNSLLVPLLNCLFVQLPIAIAHAVFSVLSSVVHGVFWVGSSVGYGVLWVVKSIYSVVEVVCFLLAGFVLLRRLSG